MSIPQPSLSLDELIIHRPMMAGEAVMITDENHIIRDINHDFTTVTGFQKEEILGKHSDIIKSKRQNEEFLQSMSSALLNNGYWEGNIWNRHKNGKLFASHLFIRRTTYLEHQIIYYIFIFRDITENILSSKRIERMAYYDVLTNLPNRTLLEKKLHANVIQADKENRQFALLFLDLDYFKLINDKHGHASGDALLIEIAQRLRANLRLNDVISRFGGDEFIVMLPCIKVQDDANIVANKIIQLMSKIFRLGRKEFSLSASIGISCYPKDGRDPETLLNCADSAMYQAKRRGGNRVVFFDNNLNKDRNFYFEQLNNIFLKVHRQFLTWRKYSN